MATSGYPSYAVTDGGRVTILDDDEARASRVSLAGKTVTEGDQGTTQIELAVRLEPPPIYPVAVEYQTRDGSATEWTGDYRPAKGTITFAPGTAMQTIAVEINGDTTWEPDEKFAVVLSRPRGALLATDRAEVIIANDDPPARVTLDDLRVPEGNGGTKRVVLTFRFDHPVPDNPKLDVWPFSGSAQFGEDFRAHPMVLYPSTGATTVTYSIDLVADAVPECDEGILIVYAGVYTGDDTKKTARLLIEDDDGGMGSGPSCPDPFALGAPAPPVDAAFYAPVPEPTTRADAAAPEDATAPDAAAATDAGASAPPLSGKRSGCAVGGTGRTTSPLLIVMVVVARWLRRRLNRCCS
jgi:hypothetical protein